MNSDHVIGNWVGNHPDATITIIALVVFFTIGYFAISHHHDYWVDVPITEHEIIGTLVQAEYTECVYMVGEERKVTNLNPCTYLVGETIKLQVKNGEDRWVYGQ